MFKRCEELDVREKMQKGIITCIEVITHLKMILKIFFTEKKVVSSYRYGFTNYAA